MSSSEDTVDDTPMRERPLVPITSIQQHSSQKNNHHHNNGLFGATRKQIVGAICTLFSLIVLAVTNTIIAIINKATNNNSTPSTSQIPVWQAMCAQFFGPNISQCKIVVP